jgi:hypothetical protein
MLGLDMRNDDRWVVGAGRSSGGKRNGCLDGAVLKTIDGRRKMDESGWESAEGVGVESR